GYGVAACLACEYCALLAIHRSVVPAAVSLLFVYSSPSEVLVGGLGCRTCDAHTTTGTLPGIAPGVGDLGGVQSPLVQRAREVLACVTRPCCLCSLDRVPRPCHQRRASGLFQPAKLPSHGDDLTVKLSDYGAARVSATVVNSLESVECFLERWDPCRGLYY